MVNAETKTLAKSEERLAGRAALPEVWRPFENLHRDVERLFDDFGSASWRFPAGRLFDSGSFWQRGAMMPLVDIAEREKDYQITAELPGMEEKDVELKVANDLMTIKGEKREEKQEKKQNYFATERRYGAFERGFSLPRGIDSDKIEASFKKGVLTITLPKKPEAIKSERKIAVKAD